MQEFLLALPVLLFSIVAHEYAHGYAALKQGDDTALMLGRLTFNPIKHIDPFMSVILPALLWISGGVMFGGAKPVPVNPARFRNYVRGDIIVSLAGVAVNFVLAILFVGLTIVLGMVGGALGNPAWLALLQVMARIGIMLNLVLVFFNLIPIPPLDGSHVVYHLLPPAIGARYRQLSAAGFLILIVLVYAVPGAIATLLAPAFWLRNIGEGIAAPYILPGVRGVM